MNSRQMSAKRWLNRYYPQYLELNALRARIEKLNDDLNRCVGGYERSEIQSNGNGKERREEMLAEVSDLYEVFETKCRQLKKMDEEILQMIEKIDDVMLKTILIERYINHKSWEEINKLIKYSRAQTFRFHLQALDMVYIFIKETKKK